jgi:hypothetical protein
MEEGFGPLDWGSNLPWETAITGVMDASVGV